MANAVTCNQRVPYYDAFDHARSLTVADIVKEANCDASGGPVGGYPRD
jgi:hypothetical protein